jgi:hypothetical protein
MYVYTRSSSKHEEPKSIILMPDLRRGGDRSQSWGDSQSWGEAGRGGGGGGTNDGMGTYGALTRTGVT